MSAKLFTDDILFLQRILAVSGFYKNSLNGKWSSDVDAALDAFSKKYEEIKGRLGEFDTRTESCIITLLPDAQAKARAFMNAIKGQPLTYRIISGSRTYAEQNTLAGKRPKVTKAKGGQSNHNFGIGSQRSRRCLANVTSDSHRTHCALSAPENRERSPASAADFRCDLASLERAR
jgi:peptidoglycan LD-endopeptidase CwlK